MTPEGEELTAALALVLDHLDGQAGSTELTAATERVRRFVMGEIEVPIADRRLSRVALGRIVGRVNTAIDGRWIERPADDECYVVVLMSDADALRLREGDAVALVGGRR